MWSSPAQAVPAMAAVIIQGCAARDLNLLARAVRSVVTEGNHSSNSAVRGMEL